jgi:hypothetical protein
MGSKLGGRVAQCAAGAKGRTRGVTHGVFQQLHRNGTPAENGYCHQRRSDCHSLEAEPHKAQLPCERPATCVQAQPSFSSHAMSVFRKHLCIEAAGAKKKRGYRVCSSGCAATDTS